MAGNEILVPILGQPIFVPSVQTTVVRLIEKWLKRSAVEPAVCSFDGNLTRGELDQLSSTLARYLRLRGVGRDKTVMIVLEKSVATVVAILAVLKAGGVFCLFDALQPRERLRQASQTANAHLAICSSATEFMCDGCAPNILTLNWSLSSTS